MKRFTALLNIFLRFPHKKLERRLILLVLNLSFVFAISFAKDGVNTISPKVTKSGGRVVFYGEDGTKVKEIDLKSQTRVTTKKLEDNKLTKIRQKILRNAKLSNNNEYVVVVEVALDRGIITETGEEEPYEGPARGAIKLLNSAGELLWEHALPEGRGANPYEFEVSNNGKTVAVPTGDDVSTGAISVFDEKGNEILRFPTADYSKYESHSIKGISPNGRYIAFSALDKTRKYPDTRTSTVFFDLTSMKSWDAQQIYPVFELTDEGSVKTAIGGKPPIVYYDLKKNLGE